MSKKDDFSLTFSFSFFISKTASMHRMKSIIHLRNQLVVFFLQVLHGFESHLLLLMEQMKAK
jgi:hypothetical protein